MTRGPEVKSTGDKHSGAAQMGFTSQIGYPDVKGGGAIVSVQVAIKTKVILPRWRQNGKWKQNVKLICNTLSSDIKCHEENNMVIAKTTLANWSRR